MTGDEALTQQYLIMKTGYNYSDPLEFKKAMDVNEDFGIVTEAGLTYPYVCYMS